MRANTVFPTRVGMNRPPGLVIELFYCVPHARGDEP